jgi:PAS domain S-box-containing protein
VVAGTVTANLMGDRNLLTATLFGICNAGEAVLVAWLLDYWVGRPFTFDDLRKVVVFLAAAGFATAASAIGGAATMTLLHTAAPFWDVWREWFLADGVGIVVVAPLVIQLRQFWRERPSGREVFEGVALFALFIVIVVHLEMNPAGSWLSFGRGLLLLPLLVALAARCPPAFAVAGTFVACITVICATIYGIGIFGDATFPLVERVKGAQAAVTAGMVSTLVLVALFAQHKKAEEGLRESEQRFAAFMNNSPVIAWAKDEKGRHVYLNKPFERQFGVRLADWRGKTDFELWPTEIAKVFRRNDEAALNGDKAVRALEETPDDQSGQRRQWQSFKFSFRDASGRRYVGGIGIDITDSKKAEDALREREAELGEAQRLAHIGSFYWDIKTDVIVASDELLRIYGFDPAIERVPNFRDQRGRCYPVEDWDRLKMAVRKALQSGAGYELDLRAFCKERPIWVKARSEVLRNSAGEIIGMRGTVQDITERKATELALAERNSQWQQRRAVSAGSLTISVRRQCRSREGMRQSTAYPREPP